MPPGLLYYDKNDAPAKLQQVDNLTARRKCLALQELKDFCNQSMMFSGGKTSKYLGNFPSRELPNQNIVAKLARRQVAIDSPAQLFYRQRSFYQCVVPNYTESYVQVPSGYLRKFSPDGSKLLGFSSDQKSVLIYDYLGVSSGQDLYCSGMEIEQIRLLLFERLFHHRHFVHIPETSENLNRECSLFTEDCQYVIVGSSGPLQEDPYPPMYEMYRNNEAVSPNHRSPLEDYTLYMIDMQAGFVSDSRSFRCDKIYLSHNQGISMCESVVAVLSVQQQTIHLFQIANGTFIPMHDIGRFCYPDDALVYSQAKFTVSDDYDDGTAQELYQPFHEKWFNSLKHRLLCWLLKHAEQMCTPNNKRPLLKFFEKYDQLASLRLWKVQLLSTHQLLMKYASEDIVTLKQSDPTSQPALIVIYDIETTEILAVFENTSEELLKIYENHADSFRIPVSHRLSSNTSSVSNNVHSRALHMKFKQTITNAKYGGRMEATRRLLGQLPICSQCHSSSPYLDLALFSYDDKWVSALERPKPCGDSPVRFFCRNGGLLSFALKTGLPLVPPPFPTPTRRLVAYIFHPSEPFVISIQKAGYSDYVVCFHLRNAFM